MQALSQLSYTPNKLLLQNNVSLQPSEPQIIGQFSGFSQAGRNFFAVVQLQHGIE